MSDYQIRMYEKTRDMVVTGWDGGLVCPDCGYETDEGHCIICHPRDALEERIKRDLAGDTISGPDVTWWLLPYDPADRERLELAIAKIPPLVQ